ncbi:MAG: tricarballylate utilization 4Fe-4S protein TcuB [Betaproteobacteria bacterium]|nr:tricarballylate utilization 4Fe-4S protein TcuB [Betaproteobacteria bacterium]
MKQASRFRSIMLSPAQTEGARVMGICNSCRYCEGFCAVFPAMERRLDFNAVDMDYLANLCHNCGACYHACQYAPPHAFALNVPRSLARIRKASYAHYAWPVALGRLYQRQGLLLALALVGSLAVLMFVANALIGSTATLGQQSFYAVIPHQTMVVLFGSVFSFAVLAMTVSAWRFWREHAVENQPGADRESLAAIAGLRYLDGGGEGCVEQTDAPSLARKHLHHASFYGFLLCFASTSVATLYHYIFGWQAPYDLLSLPVVLGTVGGILMCVGSAGLLVMRIRRDRRLGDPEQYPMDVGFVSLLFLVAFSGLVLLVLRDTEAMRASLIVHLASVLAFFVLMPYSKFVHGLYRGLAILKHHREQKSPNPLGLSEG